MKSLEQIKRDERTLAVAKAQGDLERACKEFALRVDAGVLDDPSEDSYRSELCLAYGRALNMEVA